MLLDTHDRCNTIRLWNLLRQFARHRSVMAASIHDHSKAIQGLVADHAYSIIDVTRTHGFSLIKLRNPWGNTEWQGNWSDKSPLWDKYPAIKRHCDLHDE